MHFLLVLTVAISRLSLIRGSPVLSLKANDPGMDLLSLHLDPLPRNELSQHQNLRTLSEIIWTCLITVFACSWVSVHPNIPSPRDSDFAIFRRRIGLMFWAIIAPELLMIWAMRQWLQATNLAKLYQERGWTKTHGHFLVMGGFMLYRNGVPVQTLSIEKFHRHLEAGSIDFPNITEEDILDRSKSDFLQRIIVIVQVAWFALQCITRRALGLTITELEVVTLAFTTLNGAMFAFWWKKPLDVRRPFRIDFKPVPVSAPPEPAIEITTVAKAESNSPPTLEPAAPENRYARIVDEEDWLYMSLLRNSEAKRMQSYPDSGGIPLRSRLRDQACRVVFSSSNAVVQFFKSIVNYVQKKGLVSAIFHVFVVWPTKRVLNGLGDIVESDDSKKVRKDALRVPTFYAPMMVPDAVVWVRAGAAALGVVFGSIHMAAWSGTFPSHGEQTAWRVASVIITVLPGVILLANVVNFWLERDEDRCCDCFEDCVGYIEYVVGAGGILVYVPSRFTLFIIAFACLWNIPLDGLQSVDWTSFIPHISV